MCRCNFVLADFEVPKPTRAAMALSESVVSRRNRAAISSFSGSFRRRGVSSARSPAALLQFLGHNPLGLRLGAPPAQFSGVVVTEVAPHLEEQVALERGFSQGFDEIVAVNVVQEDLLAAVTHGS